MTTSLNNQIQWVGAYRLEKTLGKGQTGLVKTGTHCVTGKKIAVKIVNKEKLNESVLQKVEREIAIMRLIEHPHILQLYDHVSGGELFDYLVYLLINNGKRKNRDFYIRKGRLMAKEARKFFRQIISALDFCHAHNICHRDLKPENLLLDERNNIKIADFGMASLQVEGSMLETSCGSPHYACPEVIRGEKYDGRKADVWSCGVILYALLVGALPFDDDNLRNLLEKVKKGSFHIPHFVPSDCQGLLRSMVEVNPTKRISLQEVVIGPNKGELELEVPMAQVVETHVIPNEDSIDPDVFRHMNNLGCFKDKEKLVAELLSTRHNTEKIVYFLLLDRKRRRPAKEEEPESSILRNSTFDNIVDPPRKRVDTSKPRLPPSRIADGSPMNPRKNRYRLRQSSLGGSPEDSPQHTSRSLYPQSARGNTFTTSQKVEEALLALSSKHRTSIGNNNTKNSNYQQNRQQNHHHYFTQPINPLIVQRASRKEEQNTKQLIQTNNSKSTNGSNIPPLLLPSNKPRTTTTITSTNNTEKLIEIIHIIENYICLLITNSRESNKRDFYIAASSTASSSNSIASSSGIALMNSSSMTASNNSITGVSSSPVSSNIGPTGPWHSKLSSTIKNSILGTPRFHRKSVGGNNNISSTNYNTVSNNTESDTECNGGGGGTSATNLSDSTSDLVKKSFFGSLSISGAERDDTPCIPVQNKTLAEIKAELIRLFLTIHELSHSVIGQNSFRVEYKRLPYIGFSRGVKFQVDIITPPNQRKEDSQNLIICSDTTDFYVVQFTLISGPLRRFRRLFEHFSTVLQNSQRGVDQRQTTTTLSTSFMVKPRKISSQSSVGSEDSTTLPPSVERQNSQQFNKQKQQSFIQTQGNPPLAEDESGFFADSVSNSKIALRAALSCSNASPGRIFNNQLNSPPSSGRRIARKSDASLLGVLINNKQKASVASWGSPATVGQELRAQKEAENLNKGLDINGDFSRPKTAISNIIQQHKASIFSWSSQCSGNSVNSSEYTEDKEEKIENKEETSLEKSERKEEVFEAKNVYFALLIYFCFAIYWLLMDDFMHETIISETKEK
ncbi:Protein kinase domain-containing protein [Meloidogyne graminicola]|uniref:non-specific serine/threonine protein kinase n=1 Tax=Meloidogyne graminicola TaxID=189291 RepID=A0A8S9ZEL9_9BILA|nr:Protein kinase domain-containing protein [Meloidogyne graminicola]